MLSKTVEEPGTGYGSNYSGNFLPFILLLPLFFSPGYLAQNEENLNNLEKGIISLPIRLSSQTSDVVIIRVWYGSLSQTDLSGILKQEPGG